MTVHIIMCKYFWIFLGLLGQAANSFEIYVAIGQHKLLRNSQYLNPLQNCYEDLKSNNNMFYYRVFFV